ncbi:cadherin domain-containing protein [Ureibacillus xyleni]|uniref:Cadherin domain-containing protein n=1 Tax=Ureibacillus xyleni TaxID=614648 RepID=A0A285T5F0_9BACL|nr:cadherin repeat domain-containing protein [Ureibacillus xyleni]SOC16591.1 cadherin domain-containing protein [Ureibacillus xyleni]
MRKIEYKKDCWRRKRFGLKKLQQITRVFIAFIMIFIPLISAIPVKTFAVTEGTANGTYDFGGLGANDSASPGFAILGDKFHISNTFGQDGTRIYIDPDQQDSTYDDQIQKNGDGTSSFVIKAEGGNTCKTFTFKDLGISGYKGDESIEDFKLDVIDKDGNEINVVNVVDENYPLTTTPQQISNLFGVTINYPDVAEIHITLRPVNNWHNTYLNFDNITIADVSTGNKPPTDITLSNSSLLENAPSETTIGTLSATDPDVGDTQTYSFVSGDTDNFLIDGNQLKTKGVFDYETKDSYSIKIRVTDSGGATYEKAFSISVSDANDAPTALALSSHTVSENVSPGTKVGMLSATDQDAGDTHTYSLVSGDVDNFSIVGNELRTTGVFDFESKNSYSIIVKATDTAGLTKDQTFTISVTNVNEAPINISLANSSVAENQASGTAVGPLTTTDPDAGDTHTYSLVSGDIGNFTISGNVLKTNGVFDFETKNSYSVKVRSTDSGGLYVEKDFTVSVTNVNESPILNNTNVTFNDTDEDTASSQVTVSSFLDSTDSDSGLSQGIAVTSISGNGTWQYLDSIWKPFPSVSNNNALLLRDTDIFKYIPDGQNGEIPMLKFRAWDQTIGVPFSLVDTSSNGGSTAFSTNEGTASLTVSDVNDAPILTSGPYTFSAIAKNAASTGVTVNDIAQMSDFDNGAISGLAINKVIGNGTWEYSLDGSTWQAFGTVSDSSALLLRATDQVRYKSINLGETASFTFSGWDQTSGTQGTKVDTTTNGTTTAFSSNTQTASIEVTKSSEANILTFSIPEELKPATIDNGTIVVFVAGSQNVTNLTPTFTVSDDVQSVKVGAMDQVSGTTANDFSNPVTYVVTAEDGTTKNWIVTVIQAPSDLSLTNNTVGEELPVGTEVGILNAVAQAGDTLTYSIQSGDNTVFEIDNNRLITKTELDYNTKNQYTLTIRVTNQHGAYLDKDFTIHVLDKTPPTADVTMISNNEQDTKKAKVGDTITLDIVANEDIEAPTVLIAGKAATVTKKADAKNWQATYIMQTGDTEGVIPFTLDFKDISNNQAAQVTAVTSGTFVTFDKTEPTASPVTIKSSNTDSTKAKIGDTITLQFETSENIQTPIVMIAGKVATVTQKADAKTWEATYTMANGDPDGNVAFTLNFKDIIGNEATEVTATTNASAVVFDGTKPTATTVSMNSSNANPANAKIGDTITLSITTNEDVQQPVVTIAGKSVTTTQKGNSKTWESTYTMQSGDLEGEVAFTIDFKDNVGNDGDQVTAVTTGTAVIFDETPPTATTVTMNSSNTTDPTKVKVGDTVTLNIVANEHIVAPTVTIAGKPATVMQLTDARTWLASYVIQNRDSEGAVPFTLDFEDLAGNASPQVTAITTGTAVTVDKTAPTITIDGVENNKTYQQVTPIITSNDAQAIMTTTLERNGTQVPFTTGSVISQAGNYTLIVKVADLAGNETTEIVSFSIYVPSPPAGPIVTPPSPPEQPIETPPLIENPNTNLVPVLTNGKLVLSQNGQPVPIVVTETIGGTLIVQTGEQSKGSTSPINETGEVNFPNTIRRIFIIENEEPFRYLETTTNVNPQKEWNIKMSMPVNTVSINPENVVVKDAKGNVVEIELQVSEDGKTIKIMPKLHYQKGEIYYVTINGLQSEKGEELKEPIRKVFIITQ